MILVAGETVAEGTGSVVPAERTVNQKTRVAWFPKASDLTGNPYWSRLQDELAALEVEFETSHSSHWMTYRWLCEQRSKVDVLHFHFIQPHYAGENERGSLRRLAKFVQYLLLARLLSYRIVWTVHELTPTWPMPPEWIEGLARYTIAWLADDVIVHCQEARRLLAEQFRRRDRVVVVPHPSYKDAYPNEVSRSEARERMGIAGDAFVVGFVGGIRPNKGIDDLIAAFTELPAPNAILTVAGRPWHPDSYVEKIRALAAKDRRVRLTAQRLSDGDLQLHINAADVLAFPFRRVLTSGSVVLAMSFGRSVIVPAVGCLPELVGKDAGFVYDPREPDGLKCALEGAMKSDLIAMGAAAARRVTAATWQDLARRTASVYRGS